MGMCEYDRSVLKEIRNILYEIRDALGQNTVVLEQVKDVLVDMHWNNLTDQKQDE